MKRLLAVLVLAMLYQCAEPETLTWEARQYIGPECPDCPAVEISLPEGPAANPLAQAVQQAQTEEIISWLDYQEEQTATNIETAITAFGEGYREVIRAFPDEMAGWEAQIEGMIQYESASLLTLSLDGYIFTGGAHGLSSRRLLNFDKAGAAEIDPETLFADIQGFRELAEAAFRAQYDIPEDAPVNSTGFMFEENVFSLPENIGFTPEGILLYYNPYEVASYADGPLEVVVPFETATPYLAAPYRPRPLQ